MFKNQVVLKTADIYFHPKGYEIFSTKFFDWKVFAFWMYPIDFIVMIFTKTVLERVLGWLFISFAIS